MRWLESVFRKPPKSKDAVSIDAKRLLTEHQSFENSRDSLGLQLTDMLASILRRALNDRLQFPGWKDFGGLLVRHQNPGDGFIQLGEAGGDPRMMGHARKICEVLDARAMGMMAERT
jgi:hypothetical protein